MSTASGITSFVLGREQDGNREVLTFENGATYDVAFAAKVAYSVATTRFPYEV